MRSGNVWFEQEPEPCRFRTNSELNRELKGGYIRAKIGFCDVLSIRTIYIDLLSGNKEVKHCNMLNISSQSTKMGKGSGKEPAMEPGAWYVRIVRQWEGVPGNLKLDIYNHRYAEVRGTQECLSQVLDERNCLVLDAKAIQLTVTKPVTKSADKNNKFASAGAVLSDRFAFEKKHFGDDNGDVKTAEDFFLADSEKECHEAVLHVRVIYDDGRQEQAFSRKFVDSNRYHMKIDKISPSRLDCQGFVRRLTLHLPSFKMPQKPADRLVYKGAFLLMADGESVPVPDEEIVIYASPRREKEVVKVFYEVCRVGEQLSFLRNGGGNLYFQLTAVDDDDFEYAKSNLIAIERFIVGKHPDYCQSFNAMVRNVSESGDRKNWYLTECDASMFDPDCETCDDLLIGLTDFKELEASSSSSSSTLKRKISKVPLSKDPIKSIKLTPEDKPENGFCPQRNGCLLFTVTDPPQLHDVSSPEEGGTAAPSTTALKDPLRWTNPNTQEQSIDSFPFEIQVGLPTSPENTGEILNTEPRPSSGQMETNEHSRIAELSPEVPFDRLFNPEASEQTNGNENCPTPLEDLLSMVNNDSLLPPGHLEEMYDSLDIRLGLPTIELQSAFRDQRDSSPSQDRVMYPQSLDCGPMHERYSTSELQSEGWDGRDLEDKPPFMPKGRSGRRPVREKPRTPEPHMAVEEQNRSAVPSYDVMHILQNVVRFVLFAVILVIIYWLSPSAN